MAGLEGLLAGRVLGGRYLIEEVIGRGGMGVVYRALDERLGRRVAVKVITLVGGDKDAVERLRARFHREARAAAALPHHPNVVAVYDYGTDAALDVDFIAMELLSGRNLRAVLNEGAPDFDEAIRIGAEGGVPVEIYHLKAAGVRNFHKAPLAIAKIDSARAAGLRNTTSSPSSRMTGLLVGMTSTSVA